jgi:hypothetical protein
MTTASLLAPLIAASVTATAGDDGHLLVHPAARITPDLRVYIRTHRDELIAELSKDIEILLSEALHHPACPGCGSTAASMLRAGDPNERCAGCRPSSSPRRRSGNPSGEAT